jgi:F-type H+-transporting ATPase subunit delta
MAEAQQTADVSAQRIARVYAEALLNAAEARGQAEAILEELGALLTDVGGKEPQLDAFLTSAAIGRHRKADAIDKVFQGRADELLVNFLQVLNDHQRLELLRAIWLAARRLQDARQRRVRVKVDSAVQLQPEHESRLIDNIRNILHYEPVLEKTVDPDLLGGMIVRVGDWLYDGSVRSELQHIRTQLVARSSHEIQSGRDRFSTASGDQPVSQPA